MVRPGSDFAAAMRPEEDRPSLAQRIMNRAGGQNGANGSNDATRPNPAVQPTQQRSVPAPVSSSAPVTGPKVQPDPRAAGQGAARTQGTPGPSRIARPETLTTGAGGTVATGAAVQSVPQPTKSTESATPTSAGSASSAHKSDKPVLRRTRKARLRLSRVDPWSVMKTAFMFSIAAGIVLVVAVYSLWTVIQASDLFAAVDQMVQDAIGTQGDTTPFRLDTYINTPKVMGATALIAAVDVVLLTALATLTAFLYNLSASVLGGLEVTLAED